MAEVTAALVTFSEAAICGSDGSRILVASVPVAASPASTAICKHGGGGLGAGAGVDREGLVGHGVSAFILNDGYHIKRDAKAGTRALPGNFGRNKTPMTVIASEAKQSIGREKEWIARVASRSSQ